MQVILCLGNQRVRANGSITASVATIYCDMDDAMSLINDPQQKRCWGQRRVPEYRLDPVERRCVEEGYWQMYSQYV